VNVAGLASVTTIGEMYLPAWTEWVVTGGILGVAALVLLFFVERFEVFESIGAKEVAAAYRTGKVDHASWKTVFFANPFAETRLYSASFVLSVGIAFGILPEESLFGLEPERTPTRRPRVVEVGEGSRVLELDGDGGGDGVRFDHGRHVLEYAAGASCASCHHMNKPEERSTPCGECHSDVHLATDIFDHSLHQRKTGGNPGCAKCHRDPSQPKTRENTTGCADCHTDMREEGSVVGLRADSTNTTAAGYVDAMHGLCTKCHVEPTDGSSHCALCHGGQRPAPGKARP
jgi:hypothetical protein